MQQSGRHPTGRVHAVKDFRPIGQDSADAPDADEPDRGSLAHLLRDRNPGGPRQEEAERDRALDEVFHSEMPADPDPELAPEPQDEDAEPEPSIPPGTRSKGRSAPADPLLMLNPSWRFRLVTMEQLDLLDLAQHPLSRSRSQSLRHRGYHSPLSRPPRANPSRIQRKERVGKPGEWTWLCLLDRAGTTAERPWLCLFDPFDAEAARKALWALTPAERDTLIQQRYPRFKEELRELDHPRKVPRGPVAPPLSRPDRRQGPDPRFRERLERIKARGTLATAPDGCRWRDESENGVTSTIGRGSDIWSSPVHKAPPVLVPVPNRENRSLPSIRQEHPRHEHRECDPGGRPALRVAPRCRDVFRAQLQDDSEAGRVRGIPPDPRWPEDPGAVRGPGSISPQPADAGAAGPGRLALSLRAVAGIERKAGRITSEACEAMLAAWGERADAPRERKALLRVVASWARSPRRSVAV